MGRYHLSNFLNKYLAVQNAFFCLILTIYIFYICCLCADVGNILYVSTVNAELIKTDDSVMIVDEYELDNTTLTVDDEVFKDVNIVFYGITTDADTVYFDYEENTLIQSLPKNFGVSILLSSNTGIVVMSMLFMTVFFHMFSTGDNKLKGLESKFIYRTMAFLDVVLILIVLFILLIFL